MYPYELKKHGIEGSATIVAIIDKKGNPLDIGLVSTEGDPAFDPPTVSAAKKWKYYPIQNEKGELGTYAIKITIQFHLEEGAAEPAPEAQFTETFSDTRDKCAMSSSYPTG